MTKKEKDSMRFSVESTLSIFLDRKATLVEDMKNEILSLIKAFGKENDGEWTLEIKNELGTTLHFLNADNEQLDITPTIIYHNDYDGIGVYGENGNFNEYDFEDVQFYSDLLALMFNSIFFGK